MPVTSVDKDPEALTMTIVADFPAPVRRLWDAYADPRQLEKFWGPPGWPATFTRHDFYPGGRSEYFMSGPSGEPSAGYWEHLGLEEHRSFEVRDGFLTPEGEPNGELPSVRMIFSFAETEAGSRVTTVTYFNSQGDLESLLSMGMEEGAVAAMSQIDEVVSDQDSWTPERVTEAQLLTDTRVRISRVIPGSPRQVWRAHHESQTIKRWLLGPEGWQFTDCQIASTPGASYRYAWADSQGANSFALTGELLEADPPHREVTTETMEGVDGPPTLNEMTLTAVEGGTLLTLVITYDNQGQRDAVLSTGMIDGMETSYARLSSMLAAGE